MYPLLGARDESSSSQTHHHPHHHDYNSSLLEDHDGVVLSYLLSQQQFLMMDSSSSLSAEISVAASNQGVMEEEKIQSSKKRKKTAAAPRKRSSGKKDRHSKISTAQGPRDRRMRLSVPIARKFFDLQDMLGFDKASKTIDWLFTKSKSAIKELKRHLVLPTCSSINSLSTSAESNEVVSQTMQTHCALKSDSSIGGMVRDPNKDIMRRSRVGKRSRDEARARARERTREKLRIRSSCQANQDEENPKDLGLCLGELVEQGRTNSMMRNNNADEHKTLTGRSIRARISRPSFEDAGCKFRGGTKMQSFYCKMTTLTTNLTESFTGNNLMQVENPTAPIIDLTSKNEEPNSTTTRLSFSSSSSQEKNYSGTSIFNTSRPKPNTQEVPNPYSINFMTNQDQDHNPNSIFIATLISQDQVSGQFLKFN